jgi:hypothetical protein
MTLPDAFVFGLAAGLAFSAAVVWHRVGNLADAVDLMREGGLDMETETRSAKR